MIITISGSAGSGKSTVGKLLAARLSFNHYSMGDLRRKMATDMGLTLAEFNKLGETKEFTDKDVDEYQRVLGAKEDDFVIDGRLSFHFIPQSVKIFLDAEENERARRIFNDERVTEKFSSLEQAKREIANRQKSDMTRYSRYYGVDCLDKKQYDHVIDTTDLTPEQVVDRILDLVG